MRLIASLTTPLLIAGLLNLTGCASDSPKKPAAATDKSRGTAFYDNCYDAYSRNYATPVGCPPYNDGYYRTRRAGPAVAADPITLPDLPPARGAVDGVLGR